MARSFPSWMKTIKAKIKEAQWNPFSRNMNKTTPKAHHNQITKIQWQRENILKKPEK